MERDDGPDLQGLYALRSALDELIGRTVSGDDTIRRASDAIVGALRGGGRVLACGNGGSAADAQHFAAELVGRFVAGSARPPLPAIALSSDPSVVTCVANDFGYDDVFAHQVVAHGRAGDVLVAISTSGRSRNVLRAVATALQLGLRVVALTGDADCPLASIAPLVVRAPGGAVRTVQEVHGAVLHGFCDAIERSWET